MWQHQFSKILGTIEAKSENSVSFRLCDTVVKFISVGISVRYIGSNDVLDNDAHAPPDPLFEFWSSVQNFDVCLRSENDVIR